jgi:hypothetical protein
MKFTLKKPSANPAQNLAQIPEAGKFKATNTTDLA